MNYGLNTTYTIPDLVSWSNTQQSRIDNRAKEREDAYRNLMQMLGRGVGAYMMGQDYRDWKNNQKKWNGEMDALDAMEADYANLQDAYDIAAADALLAQTYNNNPYAVPGNVGANQEDFALYQLGLGGI